MNPAQNKKKQRNRRPKDWHSVIPQNVKIDNRSSPAARWKIWRERFKKTSLVAAIGLLVFIVAFLILRLDVSEFEKPQHINDVRVETDGALSKDWLLRYTELNYSRQILTKTVFEIKDKLLTYPQIVSAEVACDANDVLVATLKERRAIARLRLDNELFMVAPDGILFPAGTYFTASIEALPFVTDFEIETLENGFKKLQKFESLVAFLDYVRQANPAFLLEWESISLKNVPARILSMQFDQPWAYFSVVPARGRMDPDLPPIAEIDFSALRFQEEISLWNSPDTQRRLKSYFAGNANNFEVPWRVSFVLNTKNQNKPFIEARVIPTQPIPSGRREQGAGSREQVAGTRGRGNANSSAGTQNRGNAQNSQNSQQSQNSQSRGNAQNSQQNSNQNQRRTTPKPQVNPRYQRR